MLERFTEKSINAMVTSQDIAKTLEHDKLYPLHLLLGLIDLKTGILARVLKVTGVNSEIFSEDVKISLKKYHTDSIPEIMPFSKQVRDILDGSWTVSKAMGANYIGPEHIFLVLTEDQDILKVFENHDIDIQKIKATLRRIVEKKTQHLKHPEGTKPEKETYFSIPGLFNEPEIADIMNCAIKKLSESNLEALGTEQVLQVILEKNLLGEILIGDEITYDAVNGELSHISSRKSEFVDKNIFCTPKLYNVINRAYEYSKELGSTELLPEHIMLGILDEKSGLAYTAIKNLYPNTDDLFDKIIKPIEKQKPTTFTILSLAREEARRLAHQMLGTELILFGVLAEGSGIGAVVLSELGIKIKDVRFEIEKILGFGSEYEANEIYYTARAKRLLEMAWIEAKKYKKPRIESEHILLAIIKLKDCIAMKVLTNLGVDAIEIRQGILSKIEQE
ncbi:MAG: Clp protease N-terminal domain-containing protein [Candidatus Gastranaerophilales bacterium]|nr:Clp protease N-terminal domain-containing protein [Candidatus Gastranaerophilales bacterium]